MTTEAQEYFNQLQAAEIAQGQAKLRTLALEFQATLSRLPAFQAEIDTILSQGAGIDYDGLAVRMEPALNQASELLLELDLLPAPVRDELGMREFFPQLASTLTARTVDGLSQRLQAQMVASRQAAEQLAREAEATEARCQAGIPEMVRITAGNFVMGYVSGRDDVDGCCLAEEKPFRGTTINIDDVCREVRDEELDRSERPSRVVMIDEFFLGKYPVTFAQFDIYCEAIGKKKPSDFGWGRGERPVTNVSWNDAQAYCRWLAKETGMPFRLPSEAEWEYVARAGGDSAYPWGNRAESSHANYGKAVGRTTPVGQYPPNTWGLYDMHGNVQEWVQDCWHDDYTGAPVNGTVWASLF